MCSKLCDIIYNNLMTFNGFISFKMNQFDACFSPEKRPNEKTKAEGTETKSNIELKEIIIDKPPYKDNKIIKNEHKIEIKISEHDLLDKSVYNYEEWDMI